MVCSIFCFSVSAEIITTGTLGCWFRISKSPFRPQVSGIFKSSMIKSNFASCSSNVNASEIELASRVSESGNFFPKIVIIA